MKKLILAASLMLLAVPAFAAKYELCNTVEGVQSHRSHAEQTLVQDHGRFFVVYSVQDGVVNTSGSRSPILQMDSDGTAYGKIVYGPGYLAEGFKGEHYYAINDTGARIAHIFKDCGAAPAKMYSELEAADQKRKAEMNKPAAKPEDTLPKTQHFNYKCDEGRTAFISDDKRSIIIYEGNNLRNFIFDRYDASIQANTYQDNGEYMQLFDDGGKNVTLNFGHGAELQCTFVGN